MANKILIKSSQDAGDDEVHLYNGGGGSQKLHVAELALNTKDGVLFMGQAAASESPGDVITAAANVFSQPMVVSTKAQALGTDSDVTFGDIRLDAINLGHASENTLTAASGVLSIEGDALAKLASPTFTGTPAAPTASAGTNSTQIATTAYVDAAADASALGLNPKTDCVVATGSFTDATCDTTSGSTTVACDAQTNIEVGMAITGTGIPNATYVVTVASTTSFTISNAATATGSNVTCTFTHDFTNNWTYHAGNGTLLWNTNNTLMKIDGRTLIANDRILIKNQGDATNGGGDPEQDGIYTVTTVSASGAALLLTRDTAMDASLDFPMAFVFVSSGTMNADTSWVASCDTDFAINSTAAGPAFVQFNGPGNVTAGTNISKTGNTLNVDDAFLKNDASDTMTGTLTCDGLTMGENENITLGSQTLDHDGTDFVFNDTVSMSSGSKIGNMTISNASIIASGGAISFGDETLTTTGVVTGGSFTTGNSGIVKFMDGDGSAFTSIAAHATATNAAYTLPPAHPGTSGYVLASTDAGVMSWTENTGGIADDAAATITLTDSATSAVSTVLTLGHLSSGTNAIGGGVGIDFTQETTDNNSEIGMQLEAVIADETAGTEDFDFSVKLMAAGAAAAEKFKVSSIGDVTFAGMLDGGSF